MARQTGANIFAGTLEVLAGAPLDARAIVPTKADLTVSSNFPYPYVGMMVTVQEEGKAYILKAADFTNIENWNEVGTGGSGSGEPVDLSDYATKEYVGNTVGDAITDALQDYATTEYVDNALGNYPTKEEVEEAIDNSITPIVSYEDLTSLPSINGVTLLGNKTSQELGITGSGEPVDLSNYYEKTETYSKDEVDGLIDALPSPVDSYTKTETNTLLDDKANSSDVYTKGETESYVSGELTDFASELDTVIDEKVDNALDGALDSKLEESDLPDIIDDLSDIFEGIVIPSGGGSGGGGSTLPNEGVISNFDETNGVLTYNGQVVAMEENLDTDAEIENILDDLGIKTEYFTEVFPSDTSTVGEYYISAVLPANADLDSIEIQKIYVDSPNDTLDSNDFSYYEITKETISGEETVVLKLTIKDSDYCDSQFVAVIHYKRK